MPGRKPWWMRWSTSFLISVLAHLGLAVVALIFVFWVWGGVEKARFINLSTTDNPTPLQYDENRVRDIIKTPATDNEVDRPIIELDQENPSTRDIPRGTTFDNLANKNLDSTGYIDAYGVGGGRAGSYGARWGHGSIPKAGGAAPSFRSDVSERSIRRREEVRLWKRSLYQPAVSVSVGPNASLKLVRMRVYTIIEGPRARTVVDHIFFNPYNKNLEGRFEYNLPSGASVCYYAMFVGTGKGMPQFFNKK